MVEYAIMTVSRSPCYLYDLLERIPVHLEVRIVVGSPDIDYLFPCQYRPNLKVFVPTTEEWDAIKSKSVHHRASWNYWRCLVLQASSHSRQGLVVFEDDVVLASGWQDRLHASIRRLETDFERPHALALYSAHDFPASEDMGDLVARYPSACFYGTQAMYFNRNFRLHFEQYLKRFGVDSYFEPYDLLLKRFCSKHDYPLFCSTPILAQHVGLVSTGLGEYHQSPNFIG